MNTCLIHMQMYPLGAHCPYCAPPFVVFTTTSSAEPIQLCAHELDLASTVARCRRCGALLFSKDDRV